MSKWRFAMCFHERASKRNFTNMYKRREFHFLREIACGVSAFPRPISRFVATKRDEICI